MIHGCFQISNGIGVVHRFAADGPATQFIVGDDPLQPDRVHVSQVDEFVVHQLKIGPGFSSTPATPCFRNRYKYMALSYSVPLQDLHFGSQLVLRPGTVRARIMRAAIWVCPVYIAVPHPLLRLIVFHDIGLVELAVLHMTITSAVAVSPAPGVTPGIRAPATVKTPFSFCNKELYSEELITLVYAAVAELQDISERAEPVVSQSFICHRVDDILRLLVQLDAFGQRKQRGVVYDALKDVVDEGPGNEAVQQTLAFFLLFLFIPFPVTLKHKFFGFIRSHIRDNAAQNQVIVDMDAVFICPAQIDILTITNDDPNCLAMIVVVFVQHIGVRGALFGTKSTGFPTEPHQHNTPLIGGKGFQSQRVVLEKALEHTKLTPLELIQRGNPAQIFIQKP